MRFLIFSILALAACASAQIPPEAEDYCALRCSADAAERARFASLLADAEAVRSNMGWNEGPIREQPARCSNEELARAARVPWVLLANDAASYTDWRRDEAALRDRLAIVARLQQDYLDGRTPDPRYAPDGETWNVANFARERASASDSLLRELFERAIRDQVSRIVSFGDNARPFLEGLSEPARERWPFVLTLSDVDCANTAWLREQVAANGWFDISRYGEHADEAAWLIVQHADRTPAFQGEMLALLEGRSAAGETSPRRVAYLWDRVAVKEGRPQRYGTQMDCQNGEAAPIGGLEDPEQIEERLAAVGMNSYAFYQRMMTQLAGCAD